MRLSVIIPCYNVQPYVGECLLSVLEQGLTDLEVLCVDDGSTDGTVDAIRAIQRSHPGSIQLLTGEHRGACAARNTGLRQATGTYVQFLDADDVLLPDKLKVQRSLAEAEALPEVIVGDYEEVYPDGRTRTVHATNEGPWMGLIKTRLGTTSANLWKRDALLAAGAWNEQLASSQDYELLFRVLVAGGRVAFSRQALTRVLKRSSGSISKTGEKDNWLRYIGLRASIRKHLEGYGAGRYAAEKAAIDQYLFMAIHLLAQQDLTLAVKLYEQHIPQGFVPSQSAAITPRYVWAHRLLGFQRAVKLGRWLKR